MTHATAGRGPDWKLYASHREELTRLVLSTAARADGRLCVLGAGKCNDLDLTQLTQSFREVHLVDLEPALLASAVSREAPEVRQRLVPHAPVDLSLLSAKRAGKWQRKAPSDAELRAVATATLQGLLARLPGPFDVVVSACMLTQLGFALTQSFREPHPLLGALRLCTARLHLQTLVELTARQGAALFVCDLASSSNYPLAALPADAKLDEVLRDVVAKRAFYHLARPDLITDLVRELAPERSVTPAAPWLWSGPQQRTYLVYALLAAGNSAPL